LRKLITEMDALAEAGGIKRGDDVSWKVPSYSEITGIALWGDSDEWVVMSDPDPSQSWERWGDDQEYTQALNGVMHGWVVHVITTRRLDSMGSSKWSKAQRSKAMKVLRPLKKARKARNKSRGAPEAWDANMPSYLRRR
jgi:hypothetical protein